MAVPPCRIRIRLPRDPVPDGRHTEGDPMNRMTNSLDFQAQALTLRAERQRIIAGNIANADTPGYVARDMNFAAALREATGHQAAGTQMTGQMGTAPGQIPIGTG